MISEPEQCRQPQCAAPAGATGYCEPHRIERADEAQQLYIRARQVCDQALYNWLYLETCRPPLIGTA